MAEGRLTMARLAAAMAAGVNLAAAAMAEAEALTTAFTAGGVVAVAGVLLHLPSSHTTCALRRHGALAGDAMCFSDA